jgi:predicted site-specific integrase-resolvase
MEARQLEDTIIISGEAAATLHRWRKKGKIPQPIKIGNRLYHPQLGVENALIPRLHIKKLLRSSFSLES